MKKYNMTPITHFRPKAYRRQIFSKDEIQLPIEKDVRELALHKTNDALNSTFGAFNILGESVEEYEKI